MLLDSYPLLEEGHSDDNLRFARCGFIEELHYITSSTVHIVGSNKNLKKKEDISLSGRRLLILDAPVLMS